MKRAAGIFTGVIILIALIVLSNSFFIVAEDEVAIVQRLSRMEKVVIPATDEDEVSANLDRIGNTAIKISTVKGLHFKAPFIESVEKFTSKYLTYTSNSETVNTKDGRRIEIQMYAQYRIIDPVVYKKAVGTESQANKRMDDLVYKAVINSANTLDFNAFFYQNTLEDLLLSKQDSLNEQLVSQYGLFVSDIGINRKSFPQSNVANIEEKMAKEIEKDSEKLIAEGDSEYIQAQATTDRQKAEIVSAAVEEAAIVKAAADAEAIRVYKESLQKNLGFYQFIKRMEIYSNLQDTTVFLDADSAIFNMLDGYVDEMVETPLVETESQVEEVVETTETP